MTASGPSPVSQLVVQDLTRAAIFLVVTINRDTASRAAIRSFCSGLPGLVRAVGFRDIEGNLSCVMGIGSDAWDRLFGRPRLAEQPVPRVRSDPHHAGEVSLDIAEADRTDQPRQAAAERADCRPVRRARIDGDHQKDRGAGQVLNHQLGYGRWAGRGHCACSLRRAPIEETIAMRLI